MRLLALLAAVTVPALLVAAPVPKAKKAESMDGSWEEAERHLGGVRDDGKVPPGG